MAIEKGYRHLDGALVYFNEHEVGQAIRDTIADGTVKRDDIFYCGKVCSLLVCRLKSVSQRFGLTSEICLKQTAHTAANDN